MKAIKTALADVLVIEPAVFGDARGAFFESFNRRAFAGLAGRDVDFVQDNHSVSSRGVLRGLHYQLAPRSQGKLVRVVAGEVFDVAVDIRRGSPHFGQWFGAMLTAENKRHMWIPEGFAHGFCVVSDYATFSYQCTALYDAKADAGVLWNDPAIGIDWPIAEPQLSDKDLKAPLLKDVPEHRLPELPR